MVVKNDEMHKILNYLLPAVIRLNYLSLHNELIVFIMSVASARHEKIANLQKNAMDF